MIPRPFSPQFSSNQISTLAAAGTAALSVTRDCTTINVYNSGAGDLYVAAYSSLASPAYVASNKDYPIPPGQSRIIFIGEVNDRVSIFSTAGTTAQVMAGDGGMI